jgi:Zn-dependent alcohol dehydrogenase
VIATENADASLGTLRRRYALEEVNEAFRALASGELARGLIMF